MNLDKLRLTSKQAGQFVQPAAAPNWMTAIETRVGPWVKEQGNKALWDTVLFTSKRRGVLKEKLSRREFAELLVELCPKAIESTDTAKSIRASMEKSLFTKQRKQNFDLLPETHALKLLVAKLEELFDAEEAYETPAEAACTLEGRVLEYLRNTVDEETQNFPRSVIVEHPTYDHIRPTLTVETYISQKFLEAKTPSHINAFECIDGSIDRDKIYSLIGQYCDMKGVKLFVVSTKGFKNEVVAEARKHFVGLVRVDLSVEVTDDAFVLPRSVDDHVRRQQVVEMMEGRRRMECPLLLWDNDKMTSSLVDILAADGVCVDEAPLLDAPRYTDAWIEQQADAITDALSADDLLPINIDSIVQSHGLSWQWGALVENQLGRIALDKDLVTINALLRTDNHRLRFTLAHELGHHLLHKSLLTRNRLTSFSETKETLDNGKAMTDDERGWLEHHANHFASCLLMPRKLVVKQYARIYQDIFDVPWRDMSQTLYWDENNLPAMKDCSRVLGQLSEIFDVSVAAMKWRLKRLDLLIMGNKKSPGGMHSVGEILRHLPLFGGIVPNFSSETKTE